LCKKIINEEVKAGDHACCPFKHFDAAHLTSTLQGCDVSSTAIHEIIDFVKGGNYQVACRRYFEATHTGVPQDIAVNHPNNYF